MGNAVRLLGIIMLGLVSAAGARAQAPAPAAPASPPQAASPAPGVTTPAVGTAERKAILDVVRPRLEKMFGSPIQFEVQTMYVAGNYAFLSAHPMRPGGGPIEPAAWKKVVTGPCDHTPADVTVEVLFERKGKQWSVLEEGSLCTDEAVVESFWEKAGVKPAD